MSNKVDHEETARLILMAQVEENNVTFMGFAKAMRAHYDNSFPLIILKDLYTKYMGFDGRARPTHNLETGEPL